MKIKREKTVAWEIVVELLRNNDDNNRDLISSEMSHLFRVGK